MFIRGPPYNACKNTKNIHNELGYPHGYLIIYDDHSTFHYGRTNIDFTSLTRGKTGRGRGGRGRGWRPYLITYDVSTTFHYGRTNIEIS